VDSWYQVMKAKAEDEDSELASEADGVLTDVRHVSVSRKSRSWYANIHESHTTLSLAYLLDGTGHWLTSMANPRTSRWSD
jgi:hypothetical protein